jgi:hypothetical protein
LSNNRPTGRIFSPHTYPNGVNIHWVSGRGYPLPSLHRPVPRPTSPWGLDGSARWIAADPSDSTVYMALVLGIWAGLFGPARARPENKSPKHGPARNNMGRASTARRRVWAGPQIPTRRAPSTARIDGLGLGRHGPIKPNLFNLFNLVRY